MHGQLVAGLGDPLSRALTVRDFGGGFVIDPGSGSTSPNRAGALLPAGALVRAAVSARMDRAEIAEEAEVTDGAGAAVPDTASAA